KDWESTYARDWKFLATDQTLDYNGKQIRGLNLPPEVLRKIFRANAQHWIPGLKPFALLRLQSASTHEVHNHLVNPGFVLARGHVLVQPPVLGVLGSFAGLQDAQWSQGFQFEEAGFGVGFEIAAKIGISPSRFDRRPLHEKMAAAEICGPAGRIVDAEHLLAKARPG